MIIEFFFDTVCPWCFIGKRRLEQVLVKRNNKNINVSWCSLLLNPDLPPLGVKQESYLPNKYGTENGNYLIYDNLNDVGSSVNINFNFEIIPYIPNTIDTHRLIHFASNEGKAEIALDSLFQSYFIEGRNIGETDELIAIAKKIDIDVQAFADHLDSSNGIEEIFSSNTRAHSLGISGMPSFIFDKRLVISGAQEPNILAKMIDAANTKVQV